MLGYCGVDKDSDEEGARAESLNNSCFQVQRIFGYTLVYCFMFKNTEEI